MHELIQITTVELAKFLAANLPTLSEQWWAKNVESRLTFHQQRLVHERGFSTLDQLDFAALLRVLDQNWYELSHALSLPREGRTWVKELQTVRNKWAHLSAAATADSDIYRDSDTLGRVLKMLNAETASIAVAERIQTDALAKMAASTGTSAPDGESETGASAPDAKAQTQPSEGPKLAAPTSRFQKGDLLALRSNPDCIVPVLDVIPGEAECRYQVFQDNKTRTYYESQLQIPAAGGEEAYAQLDVDALHAYLTSLHLLSPSTENLFSLRSGRIQFVPYQYRPVLKLIRADRPRLLIADEVGVGKTIEAGLIIKELRARMDISSVLIICPKALVAERKWELEMKRFDEHFTALDGPMLRHCMRETHLDGEWPAQYAQAIIPFSLFNADLIFGRGGKSRRKNEGLISLDPPPKFDLVIVDEAHHIRNSETYLHQAVRYFCDNAEAAIFLTATPVQLGREDLFTLLNVLRPDLVIDQASFEQMAGPNRPINTAVHHCRSANSGWQNDARACLDEVAQTQWGRLFIRESPAFQAIYDKLQEEEIKDADRVALTRALEELYTFSPLINRTRRRDIGEFTTRKPETVSVEFTPDQQTLHDELLDVVARILAFCHGQQNVKFMMTTIRRQTASCLYGLAPLLRGILVGKLDGLELMEASDSDLDPDLSFVEQVRDEIEALLERAEHLDPHDPKVDAFIKVLREKGEMATNKALVFSTFRHTLAYLAEHMKRTTLRFGLVHGGVADLERADLRRRFALPKEDADALDVLLSSEVGCEGLDFQFCDLLLNYDLPWNPMRIEQRIGRIDRYGQKSETVAIVNFITPGTVDADIYERCLWRIGIFQHAVGGSEEILGEITQELHDIAESFTLTSDELEQRLQQLGDNGIREIQEEQALEDKEAELFGLAIPKQSWREEIEAAETSWLSPASLQRCVSAYLSDVLESGGEFLLGAKGPKTLRLSQEARARLLDDFRHQARSADPVARQWEKWLKGADPMLSVTFDQDTAAADPNAVHLNVLHPLVRQAARHSERAEAVCVSLSTQSASLPVGTHPFALYRWRKLGVRTDETLTAVTTDPGLNAAILPLLSGVTDSEVDARIDETTLEALDLRHHSEWSVARANHVDENRELIDHRLQSLSVSHRARCKLLEDQLQRANNDNIRRMKESELARARQDYGRRVAELERAANNADIHATQVVFGSLNVTRR